MPELPEVETIRRELEGLLKGRRIVEAGSHPSEKFLPARLATGASVCRVDRRGKYLLLRLDGDRDLVIHLGMAGRLQITAPDLPPGDYVRAWWLLDEGGRLELHDVRRFGRVHLTINGRHDSIPTLAGMGPEPLSEEFTPQGFWLALKRSRSPLKAQLLSQRPIAGLGNIYADEALWLAGIRPSRRSVTRAEARRLHAAIRDVLKEAIAHRGTTFRDYRTLSGAGGENLSRLNCYGRGGLPCARCGERLCVTSVGSRTSTYCRICQR